MSRISIIGTGTWGIALANMLCDNGHDVIAWSAIEEEIDYIKKYHKHPKLKDTHILENIQLTKDISQAIEEVDVVVMAVPSIFVRSTTKKIAKYIKPQQIIVDVAKGIEPHTLLTMSEIIFEEINKQIEFDYGHIVALSGPTHAEEVSIGLPSTIVSASVDSSVAKQVQDIFTSPFMRVYTNDDVKGVELCGSLKNIIALAAGISHGLGYGDNAIAALVTRGIHEISRLGIAMGSSIHTFYGLAGLGDLVVTCTSLHSRNNQCGTYIGQGLSVDQAIDKVGMVVEGINALDAAYALSVKYHVELPIIRAVYDVVKFHLDPEISVKRLYNRESKAEIPFSILELVHENLEMKNKRGIKMKRVITYGTFDLLHYGHMNLLRRAKALGDYLIVALSTDEFVTLQKHKECYFNYAERKSLLEAMRYVDLVIPEDNWDQKIEDCKQYHIDTFVMGDDWKGKFDYLKDEDVDVIYLPRTPEISTTQIKKDLHEEH